MKKTYSILKSFSTFEERFKYLKLYGAVGSDTFGFDRFINQDFYHRSSEWKRARDYVIVRDNGCDLGIEDQPIYGRIIVHHMNPISSEDIIHSEDWIFDPEYLICVSHDTHNAIHYGDDSIIQNRKIIERSINDTCPWKGGS